MSKSRLKYFNILMLSALSGYGYAQSIPASSVSDVAANESVQQQDGIWTFFKGKSTL